MSFGLGYFPNRYCLHNETRLQLRVLFWRNTAVDSQEEIVGDSDRGDVQIAIHLCKGCGLCIAACPPGVLSQGSTLNRQGYHSVSYSGSGCTGCGICFYVCPEPGAITILVRKDSKDKSAA
jgi:NAD-dependent dihydropyrimidine dehydrogenase PreA subunit